MASSGKEIKRRKEIAPWWSLSFLTCLSFLFGLRLDVTAALTVWPASIGTLVGLGLVFFSNRWRAWMAMMWLVFALVFVDEARSIPRGLFPSPVANLRVVTLNCAGGTTAAAQEVLSQKPDIILFTESPSEEVLSRLAAQLYGTDGNYLKGPDASIVARGKLEPKHPHALVNDFVAATWTSTTGKSLNIISMRLIPPVMRIDLYDPSAWHEYRENRKMRRQEVQGIANELVAMNFRPDLIGGDFNSPPDRGVFSPLVSGLSDSFSVAGVGYGATCVNPYPCLVRIDQIWFSEKLRSARTRVQGTDHSDHRMVIADFNW